MSDSETAITPNPPEAVMEPTKEERIQAAFDKHLTAFRSSPSRIKRHPAEVTADRLGDAVSKYRHLIDGAEADAFSEVIQILNEIAEGDRG